MISYEERLRLRAAEQELETRCSNTNEETAAAFVFASTADIPWQRDFIYDKNPNKALFGERRGSKTTLMALSAVEQCLRIPHSRVLYIGLTQDSCERAMYNEILSRLLRLYQLPAKLVGGDTMRFDNGSIIYLIGLDANKKQKDKVRGVKSSLNMIDEMQSYTQDTKLIIKEVLGPAAADTKAATILGGTAGNSLGENYWYEITRDNTKDDPISRSISHPEWVVYRCEWSKNTAIDDLTGNRVCDNVRDYLNEEKDKHPGIELTDSWRQEWNAEWIVQTSSLIYRFSECNLLTSPLCVEPGKQDRIPFPSASFLADAVYILGIDLGYNDPTAMTIVAYNTNFSNKLYVLESWSKSELLVPEVAAKIRSLDDHYHFSHMVGDSSSLQVFETIRKDYNLNIQKADRFGTGKLAHQKILNDDLMCRTVVFMPGNDDLIHQLQSLIWHNKTLLDSGKYKEDPKYKNDIADSFLYAHHFSRNLWYEAPKYPNKHLTHNEHMEKLTKMLIEKNNQFEQIDFSFPNGRS